MLVDAGVVHSEGQVEQELLAEPVFIGKDVVYPINVVENTKFKELLVLFFVKLLGSLHKLGFKVLLVEACAFTQA